MTPRELQALRDVYDADIKRWALERAMYANVNFLARDNTGRATEAAFIPEDFMGRSDRAKRTKQAAADRAAVMMANTALQRMRPGVEPDELPDWAKGPYHAG
jgi:hypothetical protein